MNFSSEVDAEGYWQLELGWPPQDASGMPSRTVYSIKAVRRQEERVVLLLDEVLKDRVAGLKLIEMYASDRAKYTSVALKSLSDALRAEASGSKKLNNVQLAKTVSRHFAKNPPRRTTLNFYMYKHLRKYPDLEKWIAAKSINSIYLTPQHSRELREIYEEERRANGSR